MSDTKLVMVDDTVLAFEIEDGKLRCRQATNEETVEEMILNPEDCPSTVGLILDAFDKARTTIRDSLSKGIQDAVMSAMGFSKDNWDHRWQVDHCNGRNSILVDLIKDEVKEALTKFDLTSIKLSKKDTDSIKKSIRDDFHENYRHQMRDLIRCYAKQRADEDFKSFTGQLLQLKQSDLLDVLFNTKSENKDG